MLQGVDHRRKRKGGGYRRDKRGEERERPRSPGQAREDKQAKEIRETYDLAPVIRFWSPLACPPSYQCFIRRADSWAVANTVYHEKRTRPTNETTNVPGVSFPALFSDDSSRPFSAARFVPAASSRARPAERVGGRDGGHGS